MCGSCRNCTALENKRTPFEIVGSFSSQEEVGHRGAIVAAQNVKPDIAITFEGRRQTILFPSTRFSARWGGAYASHMDRSMITHPRFQRFTLDIAQKEGFAIRSCLGGGTNGAAIHLTKRGVPTIVIGIPVRYIHSGEDLRAQRRGRCCEARSAVVRKSYGRHRRKLLNLLYCMNINDLWRCGCVKKFLFLLSSGAGRGKSIRYIRDIRHVFTSCGMQDMLEVRLTEHENHVIELAREFSCEQGENGVVYACGGDGSLGEAASAVLGTAVPSE